MPEMVRVWFVFLGTLPVVGVNVRLYGRSAVGTVACRIWFGGTSPPFWLIRNVAIGDIPTHRKVTVVETVTSTGLAGSRFPNARAEVAAGNLQLLFDRT
jgi:hypothetical protein